METRTETIKRLWQEGKTSGEIRKIFGISRQRVSQIAKSYKTLDDRTRGAIWRRDSFQCQICDSRWKNLEVHHIDRNSHNNDHTNLVTLCRRCHVRIEQKERQSRPSRSRRFTRKPIIHMKLEDMSLYKRKPELLKKIRDAIAESKRENLST